MAFGALSPKEYTTYWKSTTGGLGSTGLIVSAVAASFSFAGISTSLGTSTAYLKLYDKATAPTIADTPAIVVNGRTGWPTGVTTTFGTGIGIRYCANSLKGGAANGPAGSITIIYNAL